MLEVGCGAGVDLARFARGGANVCGVDLTASAIALAKANFDQQGLPGRFEVAASKGMPQTTASTPFNCFEYLRRMKERMPACVGSDAADVSERAVSA